MNNEIVIRKGLSIGHLDAETDSDLLAKCYVDNSHYRQIEDVNSPSSILVGRTGSGKSALLQQLCRNTEHCKLLDPHDISIQFLEHSNIVQFFNEIGVRLDLFYRALWRHVLTVELLKLRYCIKSKSDGNQLIERLTGWVRRDNTRERAIQYFTQWGDKFWLETAEQLRELTTHLAEDVKAKLGTKFSNLEISLSGAKSLSTETRTEVKSLAMQVVSGIQISKLNEVVELLAENAFDDPQKKYYILIDKLDEDWADTETRCRFIRALIEETKSFRKISQAKIVTALRSDLLDLVFDSTRDSGFQEEKYEGYIERIRWSSDDLKVLIEKRINEVYRRQYTSGKVGFTEIFPSKSRAGLEALDYIISRTLLRPRDAIQFCNECLSVAYGRPRVSWQAISSAESIYSNKRLKSLGEEWSEHYPALTVTLEILRGLPKSFARSAFTSKRIEELSSELHELDPRDPCVSAARRLYRPDDRFSESDFAIQLLICLYHTGVIGIKISSLDSYIWANTDQPRITRSEAKRSNQIKVHKVYRHALEIIERPFARQDRPMSLPELD